MTDEKFNVSFRCFFMREDGVCFNTHYNPSFPLADIPRWIDAYKFTHPNCVSISVKIWFTDTPEDQDNICEGEM